jgi:pilus assembly protein CpaB
VIKQTEGVDVLVAAKDLAQGELLGSYALEWRTWPREAVTGDMITKDVMADAVDQMQQARAKLPMFKGEPIIAAKIVRPGERGYMSAILPEGMRAIAVPISESTAVSGFILPNDRVDVLVSRQVSGPIGEKYTIAETVLTNVKVLAINQVLHTDGDATTVPEGRTAVLEVDPSQSEILTKINASGTLSLVLRSLAEGGAAGLQNDRPALSDAYRNPRRAGTGALVIRYGVERAVPGR